MIGCKVKFHLPIMSSFKVFIDNKCIYYYCVRVFIELCLMPSKQSKIEVEKRRKTRLDFSFLEKVFFFLIHIHNNNSINTTREKFGCNTNILNLTVHIRLSLKEFAEKNKVKRKSTKICLLSYFTNSININILHNVVFCSAFDEST